MTVNRVILIGNIGQNPEVRQTNDGRDIINFSVATSEKWKSQDGTPQEKTEWHRIVCFNQGLAGVIKKGMADHWIRKGSKVYIEGQLQTRKWTDNNGIEKFSTEVVLNGFNCGFQVLSQNQTKGESDNNQSLADTVKQEFGGAVEIDDNDFPF